MVSIVLLLISLAHSIYKINYKNIKLDEIKANVTFEKDIFEIIEHHFNTIKIILNIFLLAVSIYIFIFVDSLHKSIQEFRSRLYAVAKLWKAYKMFVQHDKFWLRNFWAENISEIYFVKTIKSILGMPFWKHSRRNTNK